MLMYPYLTDIRYPKLCPVDIMLSLNPRSAGSAQTLPLTRGISHLYDTNLTFQREYSFPMKCLLQKTYYSE